MIPLRGVCQKWYQKMISASVSLPARAPAVERLRWLGPRRALSCALYSCSGEPVLVEPVLVEPVLVEPVLVEAKAGDLCSESSAGVFESCAESSGRHSLEHSIGGDQVGGSVGSPGRHHSDSIEVCPGESPAGRG